MRTQIEMKLTLTALPKMIADLIKHNLGFGSGCSTVVEHTPHDHQLVRSWV